MLLIIDNYDSFTYNIVHYLEGMNYEVAVCKPDELTLRDVAALNPKGIIISPGPGHPLEAEFCLDVVSNYKGIYPILGICLGFQVIVTAFGGQVRQGIPVHGHQSVMNHDGKGIFEGLPMPINIGRYHSLQAVMPIPDCLIVTAVADNIIMGVRHDALRIEAVQYHPESILTDYGREQLNNFVKRYCR
ncbi:anthranilate synthase component II [Macrococcus lamae]|uniref:Aminodeoxychorismate/anthranilate synthase component II n=1 Tax=Macrococcus lamae TaxID=198484 RepID=A0A4R6BV96_9STAP|nr:aminodeoxychorismate/anthranilate synthase component II [Macrococcus lamae]TDM12202.1 aminodeoxychorismate/anthranilate synthase component II [Macrococcus lamae]